MLDKDSEHALYSDMTILCVDDETSILRSLQRVFNRKSYQVLVAESAADALAIMAQQNVNVIISDMRMPVMDGPELLAKVANLYPETYRIVLSGFADFESTVAAINLGKINRFVNKPWNNNDLVSVVEEGLARIKLKRENIRLKLIVEQQNIELKQWNDELENKVKLRTKQIRAALAINERNNKASEKMLFNFIAINPNLNGHFAKNVGNLAGRLAVKLNLEKQEINTIRLAGFLTEIGMLGIDPYICTTPFSQLTYEQKTEFLAQGNIAKQILSPAQHMNDVSDILWHQYKSLKDIKTSAKSAIACNILAVARDYWRYASGKILAFQVEPIKIQIELNKAKNTKYAEKVLAILAKHPELVDDNNLEQGITTQQLKPAMVLKYNLYTVNHLLILAEGHEFSQSSIDHLIAYEKNQQHILTIVVE